MPSAYTERHMVLETDHFSEYVIVYEGDEELVNLKEQTESYEGMISVCHVLRYSPFFRKIKEILDAGTIGN